MLIVSMAGLYHGIQVFRAQRLYYEAKYGQSNTDTRKITSLCEQAHRLYPYNYFFYIWAADHAFQKASHLKDLERKEMISSVEFLCNAGLLCNPYNGQLKLIKTHLLEERSLADAIAYWRAYVDWEFWRPYNHAVMSELYSKTEDIEKAQDELMWLKGTEYYEDTRKLLLKAWKKESRR